MPYDPTRMKDFEIAEAAIKNMPAPADWQERLGLEKDEVIPYGRICKLDSMKIIKRLSNRPDGKYINVTAITPTPLGEGKTTTAIGLVEGLSKRGRSVSAAIRQPSGGPTMNIKGSAAGGGNALVIPMTEISLGLPGDINDIMNAHNLAMVALNARMQHERNYDDGELAKRNLRRLDIDPDQVQLGWIIDFCAQGLRKIILGIVGKMDGYQMVSKFGIAASSELMAILSVTRDLKDLRERIGNIIVAYDKKGRPVTASDLEGAGAMTAYMRNTINPTLVSTVEYQPVLMHAGPFANIAIGQSSVIADRIGIKMSDYHITESGFAADIGFEKFWNVKCRISGLIPSVSVITATIRALKMHGGGPSVVPGRPLPEEYTREDLGLLEKGIPNLLHHIEIVKKAGVKPVVCINAFYTDTREEVSAVRRLVEQAGARCAVSEHWMKGGEGALELADAVVDACNEKVDFKYLYPLEMPFRQRVEVIAREVYGADGVDWTAEAEAKARRFESDPAYAGFATMMAKTHLSISHDPSLKGVPRGWTLPIRDVLVFGGAKFLVPMAGEIKLMPGTGSDPAYRRIDVDTDTGNVRGLF